MDVITPNLTVEDLANASKPRGAVDPGVYTLKIGAAGKEETFAGIQLKTGQSGNRYLSAWLELEDGRGFSATPIMIEGTDKNGGSIAAYSSNFAGFVAALGLTEVPSVVPTHSVSRVNKTDGSTFETQYATLAINGDALDLVGRTLQAKVGKRTLDNGREANFIESFLPAS